MTLAYASLGSWLIATVAYTFRLRKAGDLAAAVGVLSGIGLIAILWVTLDRPPLRTLGETRWWYATLVTAFGLILGLIFDTRALAIPSCLMGSAFAFVNMRQPETMDRTLMPALQSPWFVPHVVVYMIAYSALGLSSLLGAWSLLAKGNRVSRDDVEVPRRMISIGLPFLTFGLVFGAFWAKEAWGHYWTWDPKETWAFLTWSVYVIYLHATRYKELRPFSNLCLLVVGFAVLMLCWFGVNYLPSANESVHTYTQPVG